MTEAILVTTSFDNKDDALKLAEQLLGKRLIACAQVSGPVDSLYWWKGEIEQAEEFRLVMKSVSSLWKVLWDEIEKHHPYDVPEIIATPIVLINDSYETWLLKELHK